MMDCLGMIGSFLAMGVGILLEDLWKARTGRQVGGILGRVWTLVWLILWSNIMFDVSSRGRILFNPESQ